MKKHLLLLAVLVLGPLFNPASKAVPFQNKIVSQEYMDAYTPCSKEKNDIKLYAYGTKLASGWNIWSSKAATLHSNDLIKTKREFYVRSKSSYERSMDQSEKICAHNKVSDACFSEESKTLAVEACGDAYLETQAIEKPSNPIYQGLIHSLNQADRTFFRNLPNSKP